MTTQEIRQHIINLYNQETIPARNAIKALEFLNARNVNAAIAEIIEFI
jgi:hypothetical protein